MGAFRPGTDDGIYPGTQLIRVERVVEDDKHLWTFDLRPILGYLDGLLVTWLRAVHDTGLISDVATVAYNRSSAEVTLTAVDDLLEKPRVTDPFILTMTPEMGERLIELIEDAIREPSACLAPGGCPNFALADDRCGSHVDQDDADNVWARGA